METNRLGFWIFLIAILVALFAAVVVLSPYFDVLIFASIFAIVFYPLFKKIKKLGIKSDAIAALVVVLTLVILVFGPLSFFGTKIFQEAADIYSSLIKKGGADQAFSAIVENASKILPQSLDISSAEINNYIQKGFSWILGNLGKIFSGAFLGAANFILFFFAFFYFIKDGEKFTRAFHSYSPLSDDDDILVFKKIHSAVGSVVKGSLAVAIIQGIIMGAGFWIFGIPNAFFWGSVSAIAALIPAIGTSIISIPAALYLFLVGQNFSAIGILIWGALIVGTSDNFVKPYLIGRGAGIPGILVLFSVLGGIEIFGFVGFLLGPVIMAILFALLELHPLVFKK